MGSTTLEKVRNQSVRAFCKEGQDQISSLLEKADTLLLYEAVLWWLLEDSLAYQFQDGLVGILIVGNNDHL